MQNSEHLVAAEGCILYVMLADLSIQGNPTLIAAQQSAIDKKLPLAVAYCINKMVASNTDYVPILDSFVLAEQQLADLQIPLLVVIGETQKTIGGVIYHTKPVGVYYDTVNRMSSNAKLQVHPYVWPGTVQTIAVLKDYVMHTDKIC